MTAGSSLDVFSAEQIYMRRAKGAILLGDSHVLLKLLPARCCSLVIFAPPFVRENEASAPETYVEWMAPLFAEFERILRPRGSVVIELGNQWLRGTDNPIRTTISFQVLAYLFADAGWYLLQEFHWYNPEFQTTRAEWLEDRIRFRDSVTPLYWLARTPDVAADTSRVWGRQAGTLAGPGDNFLAINDGPEDVRYADQAIAHGIGEFRDRYPVGLPRFFIELLTQEDDLVIDPFAGSCTTGMAAELTNRRWLCIEISSQSLLSSRLRFPEP